jgi:hypothetical protein
MISMVDQGFESPLLAGRYLSAVAMALHERITDVVTRVAAPEAGHARCAAGLVEAGFGEDDDVAFADEDEEDVASNFREPSPRAMLGALWVATSLLLTWLGVQII